MLANARLYLAATFVALCAVKVAMVTAVPGPIIFGDELLYRDFAQRLFELRPYSSGHYPPAYPLFLAPSFFFGSYFYEAMKVSNALASSLTIFPIFLIARLFLDERDSLLVAVASAAMPFHFVFPQLIMSENLFIPLLLFCFYLCLRKAEKNETWWDIGTGAAIGLLYLTRHITLVLILPLAIIWMITNREKLPRRLLRGCIVIAAMAIVYVPWIVSQISVGVNPKHVFGFGIASKTNPEQLTLQLLIVWTALYAAYFALLSSTTLPLLFSSIWRPIQARDVFSNRLAIGALLLLAFFAMAVTRHSWRAAYNFPDMQRLMGRYLVCLPFMFALVAAVEARRLDAVKSGLRWAATFVLPSVVLMGAAYLIVFQNGAIDPERFMTRRGAIDGQIIKDIGPEVWLCLVALGFIALSAVASLRPKFLFETIVGLTLLSGISGAYAYHGEFDRYRSFSQPANAIFRTAPKNEVVDVFVGRGAQARDVFLSLRFWDIRFKKIDRLKDRSPDRQAFVLTTKPDLKGATVVGQFENDDRILFLHRFEARPQTKR
ncbi:glycosyltransferase family 39 protein [Corticibacterium sp. UT-5YL-CI-8]|nr:glycosyltransferase family 39 protein [Tianweitania sp. UT-5YL-CI-8]